MSAKQHRVNRRLPLRKHRPTRNNLPRSREKRRSLKKARRGRPPTETQSNIAQPVRNANDKASLKNRLQTLTELRKYDCQQSRDVITRLALNGKVYKVKEEAFWAAQARGIIYGGNPIRLVKKDIDFSQKDITKLFNRIEREKNMENLDLPVFKEAFITLSPEMTDGILKGGRF